ncbi:SDR family oxidoreductase [Agromyces sp. Soil535]|uniref:SDR family oxidoreductase n=1 Tax=Agromyces sp. Soil535 TaxID=1736390 RepID=UPI0006F9AD67|nr:NAD(P)H-binding protein [Agromyces sp. Soil535]KRE31220.1 NmrA family transcriptional regulator [Agromyces sp. Soil535]
MNPTLVTGGTGRLGVPSVARLRAAGHDVRVLSRREGTGRVVGDLRSGEGIREAVAGNDTVVHLATRNGVGAGEAGLMRTLIDASLDARVGHLVYVSIVGVDRIPLGYYRQKLEAERLLEASGVPYTILRATQFHELVDRLFTAQRFLPVVLAPRISFQPIAVDDVAVRLAELAAGDPAGRVPDIGGPEQLAARELARRWADAASVHRRIVPVSSPGRTFAALAAGRNLVPGSPYGTTSFSEFLATRYGVRA